MSESNMVMFMGEEHDGSSTKELGDMIDMLVWSMGGLHHAVKAEEDQEIVDVIKASCEGICGVILGMILDSRDKITLAEYIEIMNGDNGVDIILPEGAGDVFH